MHLTGAMSRHFRLEEKTRSSLSRRAWTFSSPAAAVPVPTVLIFLLISDLGSSFNFGAHPHVAHMTGRNTPCLHCPAGFGVKFFCNETHDTVCEACEAGQSFSPGAADAVHMSGCQVCSLCGPGLFVDRKCSPSSDTLCDSCETTRSPHSWTFFQACSRQPENALAGKAASDSEEVPFHRDNSGSSDRQIEFQLARGQTDLRRQLNALKKNLDDEMVGLKELGSAVNHVLQQQQLTDSGQQLSRPAKIKVSSSQTNGYEKNPNTVLAVVLLSTFGALGLASMAGVTILIYINRRKIKTDRGYGGVKSYSDGASLLAMESHDSEEDAMI